MSKRLIRIGSGKIYPALGKLLSHEVNAVLENGRTYFGRLLSITPEMIQLIDFRDHTHEIRVKDLYEIVYDATQKPIIK